jgi:hypothetical protein
VADDPSQYTKLWEAYRNNSVRVDGRVVPALHVAEQLRARGTSFSSNDEFANFAISYVDAKKSPNPSKAVEDLVSRFTLAGSSKDLSETLEDSGSSSLGDTLRASEGRSSGSTPDIGASRGASHFDTLPEITPDAGGGGAGGGSGPPVASAGGASPGGGGDEHRMVVGLLQEIRDAIRALHEGTGATPFEERLPKDPTARQIAEEAAFGEQPKTNLGRFAQRVRGLGKRTARRLKPIKDYFSKKTKEFNKASTSPKGTAAEELSAAASRAAPPGAMGMEAAAAAGGGAEAGGAAAVAAGGGAATGGAGIAGAAAAGGAATGGAGIAGAAAAGGPVGMGMAAAVILATAAVEFGKAVYDFARAQENEVRRLAQYGAEQSVAVAQLDAERQLRDIKTAKETGASSSDLMNSLNNFEEALRPIESLITNISNTVAGRLLDIITGVLDAVKPIVDVLKDIYDALPDNPLHSKKELPQTNWEVLKRVEEERNRLGVPKWPGAAGGSPRGGSAPYGGTI